MTARSKATGDDRALAWAILKNLADRAGIPEWLGNKWDRVARDLATDIAELIARHRDRESESNSESAR